MTEVGTDAAEPLAQFLSDAQHRLERALVARFGVDDGLEAAADAMAFAVEHWPRLSVMDNPLGYLYRVGETKGRRLARRWRPFDGLVHEPRTEDGVVDVDLQRALLRLKPAERVAVVLVHGHGHSYRDVADVLDVPVTTVTNHLHRGLARLRSILERP
jgi:RNA polymerase sigma-70 factor (ECF subfamily)